ncbi:lysoplasmalogenase family protein [Vibrio hippocampi]|uniref:Lysoplasmalogenase n=1 Tax=Vibrio hippocampi TaxID=654686 RepID=A0ABM8ZKJ5_9VIBR|nr:lysoplasmalogenase family protein [Vibrio hippocampi]CAH0527361.1 hypothetical protein VHP8226_02670 [Vibrio hippocampi]
MWSWLAIFLSCLLYLFAIEKGDKTRCIIFSFLSHSLLLIQMINSNPHDLSWGWFVAALAVFSISNLIWHVYHLRNITVIGFLVGALMYAVAFAIPLDSQQLVLWFPVLFLCVAIVTLLMLLPKLESLLIPTTVMTLCLLTLVCMAGEAWLIDSTAHAFLGFVGSLVLALTAILFALNGYRFPTKQAHYGLVGGYYLAHTLMVASIFA